MMLGVRETGIFSFLNGHPAKLGVGSVRKFYMAVQVEEISKQLNCGLLLQISLTEYLKIANIGHRVWSNILRVELEASQHVMEEF